MPRPIHFDITADDPKRAIKFYETAFGWKFQKWDGPIEYYMATTGDEKEKGINGGISKKGESGMPNMNTIGVPSLESYVAKVEKAGGKVLQKMPIPGVGFFATCQDTEGNIFGIIQEDQNAE